MGKNISRLLKPVCLGPRGGQNNLERANKLTFDGLRPMADDLLPLRERRRLGFDFYSTDKRSRGLLASFASGRRQR